MVDALTDIDLAMGAAPRPSPGWSASAPGMPDNEVVVVNLGKRLSEGELSEVHRHPDPMPGSTTRTAWPGARCRMPTARRAG